MQNENMSDFLEALYDDLNTPKALAVLNGWTEKLKKNDLSSDLFIQLINKAINILGLNLKEEKDNSVNIIGNPKNRASIISFTIKGIHPHDIATILDDDGIAIRAGHHCCQILHDKLGIPASARASIGVYNSKEDIDVLSESINKCKKVFQI